MLNHLNEYRQKLTTADEAVKVIKSGDWIDYSMTINMPKLLDRALANRAEDLDNINVRGLLALHPLAIFEANDRVNRPVFTFNSWHFGGIERKASAKGYAFYIPFRYSEIPMLYRCKDDVECVDVLMLQVAPMDKHGYFNFGPTNSHLKEIARRAKYVILEVNERMPSVFGLYDECIHLSEADLLVESSEPLVTLSNAEPSTNDKKIAEIILKEIPDGATLQLGIGGMPNAVGDMIAESDLKDLGIHSEMYVDSMMKMTLADVITGQAKKLDRGKQVFGFAGGSQELYDFLDMNPQIASAPTDYVNDPKIISEFDNFISINSAIEVDIFGQVNAESAGFRQISGTGGQLDFVIGAYRSKGGKSFIAVNSTYTDKKGQIHSCILPTLTHGSVVTDPRTTPQYIVTEYGSFNLKGKSTWQRAEGLIDLAHPDFREELVAAAQKQGIWRRSHKR